MSKQSPVIGPNSVPGFGKGPIRTLELVKAQHGRVRRDIAGVHRNGVPRFCFLALPELVQRVVCALNVKQKCQSCVGKQCAWIWETRNTYLNMKEWKCSLFFSTPCRPGKHAYAKSITKLFPHPGPP